MSPSFLSDPGTVKSAEGEDLCLLFEVSGYPEPQLKFYKNGKQLQNNEVYKIGKLCDEYFLCTNILL